MEQTDVQYSRGKVSPGAGCFPSLRGVSPVLLGPVYPGRWGRRVGAMRDGGGAGQVQSGTAGTAGTAGESGSRNPARER